MKIVFSKYALLQIKQRALSKEKVLLTVTDPDVVSPSYNFREERYRLFTKQYLKVVVRVDKQEIIIVTAHWVAKPKLK